MTPEVRPNIAAAASLIADPIRAAMLWALMAGEARPAGELAVISGASPQSASGHLAKLIQGGLVTVESRGRHRYYRLSRPETAAAIEALAGLATSRNRDPQLRTVSLVPKDLRFARSCWGHLAGELGVNFLKRLLGCGWLRPDASRFILTSAGAEQMQAFGVDVCVLKQGRRGIAYPCPDWSERVPHLGGPLGRALLEVLLARAWIRQASGSRQLKLTALGERELPRFGAAETFLALGTAG
jgi:DNA-binding transcriptional ArsR family regulator